jgi:hypothetical protein
MLYHIRNEIANALVTSQNNMTSEIKNLLSNEMGKISSQQKEIADSQIDKDRVDTIFSRYFYSKRGKNHESGIKHNKYQRPL